MYVCMYAVLNKFVKKRKKKKLKAYVFEKYFKYVDKKNVLVIFLENNKLKQLNNPLNSPIQAKI